MKGFPLIRIVDDDQELLNSQKMLLETLGWEVAVYESALDFLARDNIDRPGCLILDVRMPGMTGIELQEELAKKGAGSLPIIFLSAHGSIAMAVHTLQHGAVDFLEKPVEPQKLLARVTNAIVSSLRQSSEDEEVAQMLSRVQKLSGREREIAGLVAKGLRNKEIARELKIEERTVKMHRANAMVKLGIGSIAELTRIFTILEIKRGLQQ